MDILKAIARLLPTDPNGTAGYGPFRLPERCAWMEPIFAYHDHYYIEGPKCDPPMRLSEIDARIFKALSIAATQPTLDWMDQCHRIGDICDYWPIMRSVGHYLYNRHKED